MWRRILEPKKIKQNRTPTRISRGYLFVLQSRTGSFCHSDKAYFSHCDLHNFGFQSRTGSFCHSDVEAESGTPTWSFAVSIPDGKLLSFRLCRLLLMPVSCGSFNPGREAF